MSLNPANSYLPSAEIGSCLPTRRFLVAESKPELDEYGFLSTEFLPHTLNVLELFEFPITLVVAPPWTGKTYVCKQTYFYLQREAEQKPQTARFGEYFHRTSFEEYAVGGEIFPTWWEKWLSSDHKACWLVDALDEDYRRNYNQMFSILNRLGELRDNKRRCVTVILFCRENDVPSKIRTRLNEVYGESSVRDICFAPLDLENAKTFIGSVENQKRVFDLITSNNLGVLGGLPTVLDCLKRQKPGTVITHVEVWRNVLLELLKDKANVGDANSVEPSLKDQFRAITRIAAILLLSGQKEFTIQESTDGMPSFDDLFPTNVQRTRDLRNASKYVLGSVVFYRIDDRYGFRQRHVQEWFAVFELKAFSFTRIRPLLVDTDNKPRRDLSGIFGLLAETTDHDDVRNWIIELHGGIAPRSDAAPWTLDHAVRTLDRLQDIARTTRAGLYFWQNQGLERIVAPGLDKILAQRIVDNSLTLHERELLIDIAEATNALNAVEPACQMIRDTREDPRLRKSAVFLADKLASDEQLYGLGRWVKEASRRSSTQRSIIGSIVYALRIKGLWDFATCVRYAPIQVGPQDYGNMVWHNLESGMTLENAREILQMLSCREIRLPKRRPKRPRGAAGLNSILGQAITLMEETQDLLESDYKLLVDFVRKQRLNDRSFNRLQIMSIIARSEKARRELFLEEFRKDPTSVNPGFGTWRWILRAEDVDWLTEQAKKFGNKSTWLWQDVLKLTTYDSISVGQRKCIRKIVRQVDPDIVIKFDLSQRRRRAEERKWQPRSDDQEAQVKQFTLDEVVNNTLNNAKFTLRQRMVGLTMCCFEEDSRRPTNVSGRWLELNQHTREKIYEVCGRALQRCSATPIPDGSTFPSTVIYEGTCFVRALTDRSWEHTLTGKQIEKWLPAGLLFSRVNLSEALSVCVKVDRRKTEEVVIQEAQRELRSGLEHISALAMFPAKLWSSHLSEQMASLASCERYSVAGRITLLNLLINRSASHALAIVKEWRYSKKGKKEEIEQKHFAALNALIAIDPPTGIEELKKDVQENGREILVKLDALLGSLSGRSLKLSELPTEHLEMLFEMLHDAFPPDKDPKAEPGVAFMVTPEYELRMLRREIPAIIHNRDKDSDCDAIERLSKKYKIVRRWYEDKKAHRKAHDVIDLIDPLEGRNGITRNRVPIDQLVHLIDFVRYRLIRSSQDLQNILLEELAFIGKDSREHVHMLHTPRKKKKTQKRLHEDALQAYVKCRLSDRLPNAVLPSSTLVVFIDREPLATGDQRLDIKVQSPTIDGDTATVVIEIKWSDNPAISRSMVTQLGKDYLKGLNLTHGIYLVGWYEPGRWSRDALGKRPLRKDSMEAWKRALEEQAKLFGEANPELKIVTFMIDFSWPSASSN